MGTRRLRDLSVELKCAIVFFVLLLSAGYGVAILNIHYTYEMVDGEPGLTAEDLRRSFYGRRNVTRLAAKIDGGSMEQFLTTPGDREKVLNWIQDGASEEEFKRVVSPILAQNCWRCHNPQGFMYSRPLQTFDQVQMMTVIDRGEPVPVWTRVAHTHLQSLALIFFGLGALFALTALPRSIKLPVLVVPFVAVFVDFGARFLARYHPSLVYVVMGTGALAGACFGIMGVTILYETVLAKRTAG